MTAKLTTICFLVGALMSPVAGYTADTTDTTSKTEKAKEFVEDATITTKVKAKTEKAKEFVEDATITTKVKAEFVKDKQVSALHIKVDTDHGVVKLTGNAKSKEEADKAVAIAQGTKGVVSVYDEIQVSASNAK